mmetsp:Transcript_11446/g.30202  ORF Transcript_11446/g.30202 Transcript_11446/m.30202 type:complete len:213 (-) Transcript_11446:861-1499(-)
MGRSEGESEASWQTVIRDRGSPVSTVAPAGARVRAAPRRRCRWQGRATRGVVALRPGRARQALGGARGAPRGSCPGQLCIAGPALLGPRLPAHPPRRRSRALRRVPRVRGPPVPRVERASRRGLVRCRARGLVQDLEQRQLPGVLRSGAVVGLGVRAVEVRRRAAGGDGHGVVVVRGARRGGPGGDAGYADEARQRRQLAHLSARARWSRQA